MLPRFAGTKTLYGLGLTILLSAPLGAAPIVFSDDFTTARTYDFTDQFDYCVYQTASQPTWTWRQFQGDTSSYGQAVSGGGRLVISNCVPNKGTFEANGSGEMAIIGWHNEFGLCAGGSPFGDSTMAFTNEDICLYGGYEFSKWILDSGPLAGPDGAAGFPYIDDDSDGKTDYILHNNGDTPDAGNTSDEELKITGFYTGGFDQTLALPAVQQYRVDITTGGAYGVFQASITRLINGADDVVVLPSQTFTSGVASAVFDKGLKARFTDVENNGPDGAPGVAGFDDDTDGATDELDERCPLETNGPDGDPGVSGFDDDTDGATDELDERCPGGVPFGDDTCSGEVPFGDDNCFGSVMTAGDSWTVTIKGLVFDNDEHPGSMICNFGPNFAGVTSPFGPDGAPGVVNVDDDANGVTDDDLSERGFGDDMDDGLGGHVFAKLIFIRLNLATGDGMNLNIDPQSGIWNIFSMRHILAFDDNGPLDETDEVGPGFYTPGTRYDFAFCAAGTCFGAQLWLEGDMGNPVETLGPLISPDHPVSSGGNVALGAELESGALLEGIVYRGNKAFGDKLWVIEGGAMPLVPADRDSDGDVDGVDFATFASCFNKAGNPPRTLGCTTDDAEAFDIDGDNDVDGVDFARFASCFNKAGNPPRAIGCIPLPASCVPCESITCPTGQHCEIVDDPATDGTGLVPVCVPD